MKDNIVVVRVIRIEGSRGWVEKTLSESLVSPEKPFEIHTAYKSDEVTGSIREVSRTYEPGGVA